MSTRSEQFVESYLEATSCLVDAKIAAVAFDKTLPYSITKNDRKGKGIYTVTDNEVTFDVYSEYYDLEIGQKVYVTIPNGDFSERKFISNIIKDENVQETQYNYRFPMDALILDDEEIVMQQASLIANIGKTDETKNIFKFGEPIYFADRLDSSLTRLVISSKVQTYLQSYNIISGHYGFGVLLLTKNLSMGYNNYEEAEAYFTNRLNESNLVYNNLEEGLEYIDSIISEISDRYSKISPYWEKHNLQVSTENMIGNLYKYQGEQLQARIFKVSQINSLSFIIPYYYQEGDFQIAGLTSNSILEYQDNVENLEDNLIFNDLKISWGYGQEEYNEDTLVLGYYGNGIKLNPANKIITKLIKNLPESKTNYLYREQKNIQVQIDIGSYGSLVGGWEIIEWKKQDFSNPKLNLQFLLNYEKINNSNIKIEELMTDIKPYISIRTQYQGLLAEPIYLFRNAQVYKDFISNFELYVKSSNGNVINNFYLYDLGGNIIDINDSNTSYYLEADLPLSYVEASSNLTIGWKFPIRNSMLISPLKDTLAVSVNTLNATYKQLDPRYFDNEIWYNNIEDENTEIFELIDNMEPNKQITIKYDSDYAYIYYTYLNNSALIYHQSSYITYNKFYFYINQNYDPSKLNNQIQCWINENSVASKTLIFGQKGLIGSDYNFLIEYNQTGDYKNYIQGQRNEEGNIIYNKILLMPKLFSLRESPVSDSTQLLIQSALNNPLQVGNNEGINWSFENNGKYTFLSGTEITYNNKKCFEVTIDKTKLETIKRNCELVKCQVKIEGKIHTQYISIPIASEESLVTGLSINPTISYTSQGGIDESLWLNKNLGVLQATKENSEKLINDYDIRLWSDKDSKLKTQDLNSSFSNGPTVIKINNSNSLTPHNFYYLRKVTLSVASGKRHLIYVGPNINYGAVVGSRANTYLESNTTYRIFSYDEETTKGDTTITRPTRQYVNNGGYDYAKILETGFIPISYSELFNNIKNSFEDISHNIGVNIGTNVGQQANFPNDVNICLNIINSSTGEHLFKTSRIAKALKAIGFINGDEHQDRYLYVLKNTPNIATNITYKNIELLFSNEIKNKKYDYINKTNWDISAYSKVTVQKINGQVKMLLPNFLSIENNQCVFPERDGVFWGKLKTSLTTSADIGIIFDFPNSTNSNSQWNSGQEITISNLSISLDNISDKATEYYLYCPHLISGINTEQNNIQTSGFYWTIEINSEQGVVAASSDQYDTINPIIGAPLLITTDNETALQPYPLYIENDQTYCLCVYQISNGVSKRLLWHQPLIIKQNLYKEAILNNWTGELVLDDVSQLIMSSTLGAGKKDENNLFSGVFMGAVSTVTDDENALYGLYGYTEGKQAFGFRDDGTAFIGSAGRGRILFDGNTSSITSGGYSEINPGVSLDLDDGIFDLHINTTNDGDITHATFKIQEVDMLNQENNITILEISNTDQIIGRRKSNIDLNNMEIDLKDNTINNVAKIKGEEAEFTKIIASNLNTTYGNLGTIDNYEIQTNCKLQNLNLPFTIGSEEDQEKYEISIWSILNYLYIYLNNIDKDKAPTYTSLGELEDALKNMAEKIEQ